MIGLAGSTVQGMEPIIIEGETRPKLPIELVGKSYEINTPKTSAAIRLARAARDIEGKGKKDADAGNSLGLLDALEDYVMQVFGKKVGKQVLARLDDPDDLLDIKHIVALMTALANHGSDNPPTSPSAS